MSRRAALLLDGGTKPLPPIPTRAMVCAISMTFQGLWVDWGQGPTPWFDAALFSPEISPAGRQAVYAAKRLTGRDTHCTIEFSDGGWLYHETGQPYDNFTMLDMEHHPEILLAAVREVVSEGFVVDLPLGGDDGESGFRVAMRQLPIVCKALNTTERDFNAHVIKRPGWDGVWYGYTAQHVKEFADYHQQLTAYPYTAIEFQPGLSHFGQGARDFQPGGVAWNVDTLLGEYKPWPANMASYLPDQRMAMMDDLWQVAKRWLGPQWHRPPEEPDRDDPGLAFYLSAKGYFPVFFEDLEFWFVRGQVTSADCQRQRQYALDLGFQWAC